MGRPPETTYEEVFAARNACIAEGIVKPGWRAIQKKLKQLLLLTQ